MLGADAPLLDPHHRAALARAADVLIDLLRDDLAVVRAGQDPRTTVAAAWIPPPMAACCSADVLAGLLVAARAVRDKLGSLAAEELNSPAEEVIGHNVVAAAADLLRDGGRRADYQAWTAVVFADADLAFLYDPRLDGTGGGRGDWFGPVGPARAA
jgi:hypothetical protein